MRILFLCALIFVNVHITFSQKKDHKKETMPKDGYQVIEDMHKAYEGGKWYRNFSFTQKTTFFDKDGKEEKNEFQYSTFPLLSSRLPQSLDNSLKIHEHDNGPTSSLAPLHYPSQARQQHRWKQ